MHAVGPARLWAATAMAATCVLCLWLAYGAFLAWAYGLLAAGWIASARRPPPQKALAPSLSHSRRGANAPSRGVPFGTTDAPGRGPNDAAATTCRPSAVPLGSALPVPIATRRAEPTTTAGSCHTKEEQQRGWGNECDTDPEFATTQSSNGSCPAGDARSTPRSASATLYGRRFVVTHAAHSTGRHEAIYVLASACAVGICDVIGCALAKPTNGGPEMVLIEPDGFVSAFWREGQVPMAGTKGPLAPGDCVTVALDADARSVHFSVNGVRVAPEVPLSQGGTYAFITDDGAAASSLTMIADRKLRRLAQEPRSDLACF
ncbi:Spry domain-containing protein [Pandoravirus kuranda]|uniref:Spry domain-containing protein n=1 Tax=Pandoravirus kuranda TaxID=3019033 RepID=A0AA95J7U7_9VIRU|nr:Spry domain-containing protein [Pandoravirus kuranda]